MIKDSGKKLFDVVLVWKFDRFARNRFDSANYKMILKKNGVHLISVMEPIAEGSQGILVETLLEGMAEYYSAEPSEKVIRGQTENALKGKCTGGTGTIGYKIDDDKFYHLDPMIAPQRIGGAAAGYHGLRQQQRHDALHCPAVHHPHRLGHDAGLRH